ncbi:MAG: ribosome-binding factor A [Proteobacteria bacterium]|nr:MAG: ribosome-binding factor A [Pseudomonadota bacterium]
MNDAQIKRQRTASILKELIPEILSNLNDDELAGLCVTDVVCSRGRYDADVYLDKMIFDEDEQRQILQKLKKVSSFLQNQCASSEGWYRSPKFHFKFDEQLEKQNRIEDLFRRVESELKKA